jgi:transposase
VLGDFTGIVVLGDRGFDDDTLREHIKTGGGVALIAGKSNRKEQPFSIPEIGWQRQVVENFFARIKRYRRVNTSYDRLAESSMAFVNLAALADWIRS